MNLIDMFRKVNDFVNCLNEIKDKIGCDEGTCSNCCKHFQKLSQHLPHCKARQNKKE